MVKKESILKVLGELRKEKKRKFSQTVDLIVNLKNFDLKRDNISLVIALPNKVKDKKICGFLTKENDLVDSITQEEFSKYRDAKELKKLVDKYDSFISFAGLMPAVATTFGKVLGPVGKMPSPKLGLLMKEDDHSIKEVLEKVSKSIKISSKQPSLKISVGKEDMKDEEIIENILAVYKPIFEALPRKKEQLKSILIKFTMSKPIKLEID